ncbi:zinc finger protein 91 [Ceratitis capitata]|nr:zinc finger protein 91 [Ceratitis capitata]
MEDETNSMPLAISLEEVSSELPTDNNVNDKAVTIEANESDNESNESDCDDSYENNDDKYQDTDSESSYHFEYAPEVDNSCLVLPKLDSKKNSYIRNANHMYGKYVTRQCPMCDFEFSSAYCWKKHINIVHNLAKPEDLKFKYNEVGAKCKSCDFQTSSPDFNKLLDHQILHMPFSQFLKCKLCDWRTTAHPSMNFHLRQQHSDKMDISKKSIELTICPYCQEEFSSHWYLRKHMIQEHERTINDRTCFICLDCGEEFSSNTILRAHVFEKFADKTVGELGFQEVTNKEDNNKVTYKCTQCLAVFRKSTSRTFANIREHYMLHLGEPTGKHAYKCRYCEETFRRFDNIRVHVCEELRKMLQNDPQAKINRSLENKLEKHIIPQEPIERKRDYMKYIRHVCLKCGSTYGKLSQCKKHMMAKHGMNKPTGLDFKKIESNNVTDTYECAICEEFTCVLDLSSMLMHARIHNVYDPFQCKLCNTFFAYEHNIPGHECVEVDYMDTTPINETRYPREAPIPNMDTFCPKCDQTYTKPSSLTRHMNRMHGMNEPYGLGFVQCEQGDESTENAYRCYECENFIITEKNLRAMLDHARQHLPYESFQCTLCKEKFRMKEQAKKHECPIDDAATVPDKYNLKILNTRLHNKMGRICPKCDKKFVKSVRSRVHVTKMHGMDKPAGLGFKTINSDNGNNKVLYQCMQCNDFYMEKLDFTIMAEHAREHFQYNSFWCIMCDEQFRFKVQAVAHKCLNDPNRVEEDNEAEVENKTFTKYPKNFEKIIKKFCPECDIEMPTIKAFRWHLGKYHEMNTMEGLQMKQTKGDLVECLICKVQTTHMRRYDHRFLHLPFKPYQCEFCKEYFIELEKAKSHCVECDLVPKRFEESKEVKKPQQAKKRTALSTEYTTTTTTAKKSKKGEKIPQFGSDGQDSASENENSNKTISVVLADDNDFSKFVKITCPFCPDTEFESHLKLIRHFNEIHNNFSEHFTIHPTNSANCKTCNKYFNIIYKKTMVKHYLSEIEAKCFFCRLCDKKSLYFERMRTHLLDGHKAVIAGQSSQEQNSANNGTDVETDPLKMTAVDISKVSRTTMAIPTNKTAVFNEFNAYISYSCPECNEPFVSSEQWHLHINTAHSFFEQNQLNIEATPDGHKRCKQCSVNISGGILAEQRHKLTHMEFKSFICTLCQHRSNTLGVLTQHLRRRHFAKGTFKCPMCTKVLSTSCERSEHIKSEHDPSEYPEKLCRVCLKLFTSNKSLNIHMDVHDPNRKVFPCDYCERSYMYNRELVLHVRAKHPKEAKAK